jgi:hypothetical protein
VLPRLTDDGRLAIACLLLLAVTAVLALCNMAQRL